MYVTHDQVEAMTMGDRVAVMRDGRIAQVDTPQTLYDSPANLFVAGFIGSPAMNLVRGRIEKRADGGLDLVLGSQRIAVSTRTELVAYEGREVVAGFRPEQFDVSYNGSGAGRELVLNVLLTEALGSDLLAYLELDAPALEESDLLALPEEHTPITARLSPGTQIRAGERVTLLVDPAHMHFFDPDTELAIT